MAFDSEDAYEPSDAESVASEAPDSVPEDNQSRPGLASSRLVHGTPEVALGSSATTPQYAQSPRKRRATQTEPNIPLKRLRSAFNAAYLDLLNRDISDAAAAALRNNQNNAHAALEPSQIGAVYWRASEKDAFFSALGRLGRDNHVAIAARIGSKSPLEVAQFITLLSECEKTRKDEHVSWYEALRPIDIPAAAEISHECCVALDRIADDVSIRQETHEQAQEEKRWGEQNWLVTQSLVGTGKSSTTTKKLEGELPFADLFVLPNWLKLSERVFMNSSIPDCNWRQVSEEPPAIRATALSDLHELAKSFTKRLVATTLFMSESRIKARRAPGPRAKQAVKARDVHTAVESLNLKTNSREFWARAARRLRLDVQGDATRTNDDSQQASLSSTDDESTDSEDEIHHKSDTNNTLSYDEVEAAFGIVQGRRHGEQPLTAELSSQYVIDGDDTSSSEDEANKAEAPADGEEDEGGAGQRDLKDSDSDAPGSENMGGRNPPLDREAIDRDFNEAVSFSAEVVETTRAREGLRNRITAEHVMEAEAAAADAQFNAREEAVLWNVIKQQRAPSESHRTATTAKREKSSDYERDGTSKAASGFTNRATMEPGARNWREGFRYIAEWETYGTFPAHEP